jgi:hypothetical protein
MYYVRIKSDPAARRWKVREAVSLKAAWDEINHARVTGSIGGRSELNETYVGGGITVLADVVQVNSDNTERQPYTAAY